jgi:hypothetical protein
MENWKLESGPFGGCIDVNENNESALGLTASSACLHIAGSEIAAAAGLTSVPDILFTKDAYENVKMKAEQLSHPET